MSQVINFSGQLTTVNRKLDVIIPSFNRPARLYNFLESGLNLKINDMFLVVIDDGSTLKEPVKNFGNLNTYDVCKKFKSPNIIYYRNEINSGLATSWNIFYEKVCNAKYTLSVTDKDEFIDGTSIIQAITMMDKNEDISAALIPLKQKDRSQDDFSFVFKYEGQMSGKKFLYNYVRDTTLMHCSMWGIYRLKDKGRFNRPRSLNLWSYGLDDSFGVDLDFVWNAVSKGDVYFFPKPHVRRSTIDGGTERYPLTFAYTYYQYAKRISNELLSKNIIDSSTLKIYKYMWLTLILTGFEVSINHVHGSEKEVGRSRIRKHLKIPVILYVLIECLKNKIMLKGKLREAFVRSAKLSFTKLIF